MPGLGGPVLKLVLVAAACGRSGPASLPLDWSLLAPSSEEYLVTLEQNGQRQPVGRMALTVQRQAGAPGEWLVVQTTAAGPVRSVDSVWIRVPIGAYRQVSRGTMGSLEVSFQDSVVTGNAVDHAGRRQDVRATGSGPILPESLIGFLARLLPLASGYSARAQSYGQAFGLTDVVFRVVGTDTVAGGHAGGDPADAWRLSVGLGSLESSVWVDRTTRRDLRAETRMPDGGRMIQELRGANAAKAPAPSAFTGTTPTRFEIPGSALANLRERVRQGWAPGFMVGVIDADGARFHSIGTIEYGNSMPPDENTIYEIGSVTKALTGLLLAEMALRGGISLNEPITREFPELRDTPLAPITPRLLAGHRAGLPRDLPDLTLDEATTNPFAAYDTVRLRRTLPILTLLSEPGTTYAYSNIGFGLLGEVLARRARRSYDVLLSERITGPLGMTSTGSVVATSRLAPGHRDGLPVPGWDFRSLHGAGSLRSTAADLTRLLGAALGLAPSPLERSFRLAEAPGGDTLSSSAGQMVGLGWHLIEHGGRRVVWHDGGTGGYRSLVAYDRARGYGVTVLGNSTESLDDISAHLLDPSIPLAPVPRRNLLPADRAGAFTGTYQLTPAFALTVAAGPGHLVVQGTGQAPLAAWWDEGDRFFYRTVAAELLFTRDAKGNVDAVVLRQNGLDQRGPRVGAAPSGLD